MTRVVYLENWQESIVETIADIERRIGPYSSVEQTALVGELEQLRELIRQVREVNPGDRQKATSFVLWTHMHQPLQLPSDLIQRVAEIFDIYRRFRTRLIWCE